MPSVFLVMSRIPHIIPLLQLPVVLVLVLRLEIRPISVLLLFRYLGVGEWAGFYREKGGFGVVERTVRVGFRCFGTSSGEEGTVEGGTGPRRGVGEGGGRPGTRRHRGLGIGHVTFTYYLNLFSI